MPADAMRPLTETDSINALWKLVRRLSAQVGGFGSNVRGARDRYVISNTVTTDYALSYVPIALTVNLFLNGVALDEGVDYSIDYTVPQFTLTASATRANDDVLSARYLTLDVNATDSPTTLIWGIRSDAATIIASFDATALVETSTNFTDISAHLDPGSGEICLIFGAANLMPGTVDTDYLFLRVGTGGGLWHFTRVGGVDTDTAIHAFTLTGSANYQVTRSGSTLTIKKAGVTVDTITLTGSDATALDRSIVGLRGTHATSIAATSISANGAVMTDSFTRPDADQLGRADTGQPWVSGTH